MKLRNMMRISDSAGPVSLVVVLALASTMAAQSVPQSKGSISQQKANAPAIRRISASAIWLPGPDFVRTAHAACGNDQSKNLAECFLIQMTKAGAPPDAVQFSRRLYRENGGEFGVMLRFQELGPVDMAKVLYPLRKVGIWAVGSRNVALLLVNGDPPILDVDDLKKLDIHGMEQDGQYQFMIRRHPDLELYGGGRQGTAWELVKKRPDGGQGFDIYYVLNPGPPAGRWISGAHFDWNFDASGKFLGTKFTGGVGPLPD